LLNAFGAFTLENILERVQPLRCLGRIVIDWRWQLTIGDYRGIFIANYLGICHTLGTFKEQ
jgi:hypothetical protein